MAVSLVHSEQPIVGAIRWDAYWSEPGRTDFEDPNLGVVTRTTTYDMSPKQWHYRVPFFGQEINDTAITCDGNRSDVMAQELEYAASHGINFWSFCNYPIGCSDLHPAAADCPNIQCCADNVGLSYAWNQYMQHPDRHKVNFTLLLQPGSWFPTATLGGNETLEQELQRYVSYFRMPNYQKVLGNRPLVFLFGKAVDEFHLLALRNATLNALGVYPYVASMNGQELDGIDSASQYAQGGGTPEGAPFVPAIAQKSQAFWDAHAQSGKAIIPTVHAGWDPRPRYWNGSYPCPWGRVGNSYVTDPTMPELENYTYRGLKWVSENRAVAEANVLMLSAWNEHDEGHWIAPALPQYGGAEKLQAIKRAIDRAVMTL